MWNFRDSKTVPTFTRKLRENKLNFDRVEFWPRENEAKNFEFIVFLRKQREYRTQCEVQYTY